MRHFLVVALLSLLVTTSVQARDTKHMMPIKDAMSSADFTEKLNAGVKFYFGDQPHGPVVKRFGEFVSNKKTNAFGKSDDRACQWVLLSALLSLQDRALAEGGNAVINIKSYYKKNEVSSNTEYECHAGGIMAGVTLKGTVVKLQ